MHHRLRNVRLRYARFDECGCHSLFYEVVLRAFLQGLHASASS